MTETHAERQGFTVSTSVCSHHFGFLRQRPKGTAIPEECLTCEKILECMAFKPEDTAAMLEAKPEFSAIKRAKVSSEESGKKKVKERIEKEEATVIEVEKLTAKRSDDDFAVESPGLLYAQWSSTVLICRETLHRWGRKVKEVEIETDKEKRIKCKVHPIEGSEIGVIQIPGKLQLILGVGKGCIVKVKPVVKS